MTFWIFLIGIIAGVLLGIIFVTKTALESLRKQIETLTIPKEEITEKLGAYSTRYPYDLKNLRYIGTPVDGVQFEDDQILFVAFKTDQSSPSPTQKRIKKLIEDKKIQWLEFKMK
jgi:predicted Holliday junction resolvase-like endonuclease